MEALFMKLVEMSVSASWLVLVVLLLRLLLKNAPRWIHVALWALVAVRLLCPFIPESGMSLIPDDLTEEIVELADSGYYGDSSIYSKGSEDYDTAVNSGIAPIEGDNGYLYVITQPGDPTRPVHTASVFWTQVWMVGVLAMAIHAMISYTRLKRKVSASIHLNNGVHLCDYIDTPFILGFIRPRIYLPSAMEPDSAAHVLAHERAHIARRDHWWKPLGYLLLTVHWFNPLMWLAYILLCRDIELACDEKVVKQMALPERKSYSDALLQCSVRRMHVAACPLAFGEVGVKERVKTVLNYKKPAFWIVLVAVIALIVTAVCFLTDPVEEQEDIFGSLYQVEKVAYRNPILSYYMTEANAPMFKLTEDQTLQRREDSAQWEDIGTASEIKLSAGILENLFFDHELGMEEDLTLAQLGEENLQAWLVSGPNQDSTNSVEFYLLLWQESGEIYLAQGISFSNVYPLHESVLDSSASVNWLFRLKATTSESPYWWTSTVEVWDIRKAWVRPYGQAAYSSTIEGSRLDEFLLLLKDVKKNEIVERKPSGIDDPLWNFDGTSVHMYYNDGMSVWIRYVDSTAIIGTDTEPGVWETDGYWVIENEALKAWLQNLANGGTYMLSDENRDEIRRLVQQEHVQFFSPQEYDDMLFVGCAYDNGRGLGVACFEKVAYGYKLRKLIRDEEVKQCASGGELYYCDFNSLRIFLVMNQSVTGMEWAGAYETVHTIDTHPGLVVEYFPQNLGSMYRFIYSGSSTTMYMDWDNQTYGQPPEYRADAFADPNDAYSVCSNLKLSDMVCTWVSDSEKVDAGHERAITNELTADQTVQLLNLLHGLPETAFEKEEYPTEGNRWLDIFTQQPLAPPYLELKLHDDAVYFRFCTDLETTHQGWKIQSDELKRFLGSFYGGDTTNWNRFAPYPIADGEITVSTKDAEIIVPNYLCFRYEQTNDGIRFKPEDQSGWVVLKTVPGPLEIDSDHLKTETGIYFGKQGERGHEANSEIWSYVNLTISQESGEYYVLLLNEDEADWVREYGHDIYWMIEELEIRKNG